MSNSDAARRCIAIFSLALALILPLASQAFQVPGREPITLVQRPAAGFVGLATQGPFDQPTLVGSHAQYTAIFGAQGATPELRYLDQAVKAFFDNLGTTLYVVRASSTSSDDLLGTPGVPAGLATLAAIEDISLVAVPGITNAAVQAALVTHCEQLERFCLLDANSVSSVSSVLAQRTLLENATGHGALFFPWVRVAQAGGQPDLDAPPSGFAAGIYTRDQIWDSPAGLDAQLIGGNGLTYALNSTELGQLNSAGVNGIRFLSGQGDLLWGARTLSDDASLRYVAVRRTLSALRISLEQGLVWTLYEPNNVLLWDKITEDADNFLYDLYTQGAFQGTSPTDAYFSQCGLDSTMTQQDILDGTVRVRVGFAPLAPAEFVVLDVALERANLDSDGDGLLDVDEDANGNRATDAGETNPYNADSDYDGVDDGVEDANRNGTTDNGETNPLNPDSDGDGLSDGFELYGSGTNPGTADAVYTDQTLPPAGDLDSDGDTDLGDLLLLQQQLLGQ